MKIGFGKSGITLNSEKLDPLNLDVKGHGIEMDEEVKEVDAFELLDAFAGIDVKGEDVTKKDKIGALQEILSKVL